MDSVDSVCMSIKTLKFECFVDFPDKILKSSLIIATARLVRLVIYHQSSFQSSSVDGWGSHHPITQSPKIPFDPSECNFPKRRFTTHLPISKTLLEDKKGVGGDSVGERGDGGGNSISTGSYRRKSAKRNTEIDPSKSCVFCMKP